MTTVFNLVQLALLVVATILFAIEKSSLKYAILFCLVCAIVLHFWNTVRAWFAKAESQIKSHL